MNNACILQLHDTHIIFILKKSRLNQIALEIILWHNIEKYIEIDAINDIYASYWIKDGKKQGPYKEWWDSENTRIRMEYFFKEGKEEGPWKCWHENGNIHGERFFKEGKEEGLAKWWWRNGLIEEDCVYKDDVLEGPYKRWHNNGEIYQEGIYKDDKFEGWLKHYYLNGAIEVCFYENGELIRCDSATSSCNLL